MRTRIGIKFRKSPTMCITVSMKSVEFCMNSYHCTHSNGNSIQTLRNVHTHSEKALRQWPPTIGQPYKHEKSCDLDGKHRKNVHFYCFRVYPNPICRLRAEKGAARIDIPCDSNFQIQQRRNCHRNKTPYALWNDTGAVPAAIRECQNLRPQQACLFDLPAPRASSLGKAERRNESPASGNPCHWQ